MFILFDALLVLLGFLAGWVAHRRVSLSYRTRWLEAVKSLQDKSLENADLDTPPLASPSTAAPKPLSRDRVALVGSTDSKAVGDVYEPGRWSLTEWTDGTEKFYYATRRGFDRVPLGSTANYARFKALYRRDRESALDDIERLNRKA